MRKPEWKGTLALCMAAVLAAPSIADEVSSGDAIAQHPEVKGALSLVDGWIDSVRDYDRVPGISAGFVVDQSLIFSEGYGFANLADEVPADADTIYSICSISKLFTAIGVMQMRDQGELTLRDPVADHLDWFDIREDYPEAGPVRIEGLLTHSSGLPRESDFPYWAGMEFPFPDREAMIERVGEQTTLYPADTRFQYSNLGLALAGEIVQEIAGESYADYVTGRILEPIGLDDTRPRFPDELHGTRMAIGYTGIDRSHQRKPVPPFYTRALTPAAGFTSNVNDLAKFASWNFRTLAGEPNEVLAANTLREMQRVHWVDPDWETTWGLGFVVREAEGYIMVGHGGGCPGYITQFVMVPKHKLAAIALTNAGDGPAFRVTMGMLRLLGLALEKAMDGGAPTETMPDFSRYEGRYGGNVWGGEMLIRQLGDQLAALRLPTESPWEYELLRHVEGDTFVRVEDGEEREQVVFQTDDDGRVTGVVSHSHHRTRL